MRRAHPDLNQGPADLQSAALTTELCTQQRLYVSGIGNDTLGFTCIRSNQYNCLGLDRMKKKSFDAQQSPVSGAALHQCYALFSLQHHMKSRT